MQWRHLWDIRDIHGYPCDFNVSGSGDTLSQNLATYFHIVLDNRRHETAKNVYFQRIKCALKKMKNSLN